jgi:hypothetical protein
MLLEAADLTGTRQITAQDVEFLDTWEPTPWLCAEPDTLGKDQLITNLRGRYDNLVVAWRRMFDRNNKNHVTFKEFQHMCLHLQLKNAAGLWRALDQDNMGFISLKNIDNQSAQVLLDFKEWAEDTFGSIPFAFRVLDTTHSNAVSLPVFKRVLSDFGFQGDARVLFQSLKPDAGGRQCSRDARLRLDDMKHLSSWESQAEASAAGFEKDLEDIQAADTQGSEVKSKSIAKSLGQEAVSSWRSSGSQQDKMAEELSIAAGSSLREHGSSRSYSSMSDFFHFCRVPKEHEIFEEVSARHTKQNFGKLKKYCLSDVLRQAPKKQRPVKLPPSPYGSPFLSTGMTATTDCRGHLLPTYLPVTRGTAKRPKIASSLSLPVLQVHDVSSDVAVSSSPSMGGSCSVPKLPVL